jgi:hypothetical protein
MLEKILLLKYGIARHNANFELIYYPRLQIQLVPDVMSKRKLDSFQADVLQINIMGIILLG